MPDLPIVKVENLTVQRGRYAAVQDVSFTVMAGTSTAIVGPNGSGKSTLVQAVLGLLPRSTGTIEIFGRPLTRLGHLCHRIGYMPQNFIFDRSFPIAVNELVGLGWVNLPPEPALNPGPLAPSPPHPFRFPWQPHPVKTQAITQALHRVNAYHLRHQAIGTLSGGELKRVLLAYCLVMPRQLLILDEAFAEVDIQGEADFHQLLDELRQAEGWTILQVSHDLDMVSRHCDHVLCLNRALVCSGNPQIALSSQNLLTTYGPGFSRYHHQH